MRVYMKWATRNPLFFLSRKLDKRAGSKQCVVPFLSKNRAKRNMYLKQNNTKKTLSVCSLKENAEKRGVFVRFLKENTTVQRDVIVLNCA